MAAVPAAASHEIWVFDADELLKDLIKFNDSVKNRLRADLIGLTLFLKSAKQSVQQIKLLGVMGHAYHKIGRNGKRYIIFKGSPGARPDLHGTRYLATNPKVACFVVGGREIIKDAASATKIAVILLVAFDVIREFHEDHFSLASLGVRVLSDVIQAAGSAAIGAAAGVFALTFLGAPAVLVFAIVVAVGFAAGVGLTVLDEKYHLTDRARARMMAYEDGLKDKVNALGRLRDEAVQFGRAAIQLRDNINQTWRMIDEFRHFIPRLGNGIL
jgi:hypothetical protein